MDKCTHAHSAFTQNGYEANFEIFSKVYVNGTQVYAVHDPVLALKPADNILKATVIANECVLECEVQRAVVCQAGTRTRFFSTSVQDVPVPAPTCRIPEMISSGLW